MLTSYSFLKNNRSPVTVFRKERVTSYTSLEKNGLPVADS